MDADKNKVHALGCFDDLIGIRGCNTGFTGHLFVNDLAGISNELLDKIADNEQETYYGVFQKALRSAITVLRDDVIDILLTERNRKKFATVLYETDEPRLLGGEYETFDAVGALLISGASKYVVAHLNGVKLSVLNDEIEAVVYLYDLEEKKKVLEFEAPILLKQGINEIRFEYSFEAKKSRAIMVCIEAQALRLEVVRCNRFVGTEDVEMPCRSISNYGTSAFKNHLDLYGNDETNAWGVYCVGYEEDKKLSDIVDFPTDYLCLDMSVECSIDSFICQHAKRIAPALLYSVGSYILLEKLGGFRTNYFAKGNLEFTKDTQQMMRNTYKSYLKKIVRALPIGGESMCWECEAVGVTTQSLV